MADGQDDILAIQQLKARYFRYMDTRDWAAWRTVFTDDVVVKVELSAATEDAPAVTSGYPVGGDAFVAAMSEYFDREKVMTVHHGHMPEITLAGPDTATGIWAMEDKLRWRDGSEMHGYGHYHEEYRRVDGQWRIASLHLTRLRVDRKEPTVEGLAGDHQVPFHIVS